MGTLLSALATWLQGLVVWFVNQVWVFVKSLVALVLAALPSGAMNGSSLAAQFNTYAENVNAWIPLDYGCTLVVLYYTYLSVQMSLRFIKSWVPTVSG